MRIAGIDNGKDGAIVVLDGGSVLSRIIMPTIDIKGGKREFDLPGIVQVFKAGSVDHAFVERAQAMPAQGVSSTFSIGHGFGLICGVLAALQIPTSIVRPQTWQGVMFRDMGKSDTKALSMLIAGRHWPKVDWRATVRCKNLHDGLTDAACIAEYGRRLIEIPEVVANAVPAGGAA